MILPFDLATARNHAKLWAELEIKGERIGPYELMIAATCLTLGHRMATLNEGAFGRVPGLTLAEIRPFVTPRD